MSVSQAAMDAPKDVRKELLDADTMVDQQQSINESVFTRLNAEYEETQRTVNFLEQALDAARNRGTVLGQAVEYLNAPQAPKAALR